MYRCEFCNEVVPAGVPSQRVVVETREKRYPFRENANEVRVKAKGKRKEKRNDPGGVGREIVREAVVCPRCADQQ